MGGSAVEIEVVFLYVLSVVALVVVESEGSLLYYGIVLIPERKGKTELLLVVGYAGKSILAPAVCAGTGLVVGEVCPGISGIAVILPDRTPLPFTQIRAPFLPDLVFSPRFF